ncbi:type II toxin-antitoxin system RelE/ParE family toxin [Eggerthella lenta]|uniref:Type II toxin-antitoxin system RelE/ParE family toxin n=1 Tax=Eggerthella lenta TaxID=84112 RepID=A0A5C5CBA9_EGGLN|nr:type II toxin-antitoxin system RelE/ParE family toxin [Eggerthella lenta]TNU96279.1 type II toxin-antitoxin system RelE/ParE family toxin [Eggerthella lenta]
MWELSFLPEAREDLRALDGSQRMRVVKAIAKVQSNPLSSSEGGYGKPLGNKRLSQLSGLMKVKLKSDGIRIVYKLERIEHAMRIVVIGVRSDDAVYREAQKRRESHGL